MTVERIARAIAESYGQDPDDYASVLDVCGPNNEPLPVWHMYTEQAEAVLALAIKPDWRCFHCDEVFTTEHAARLHFGDTECQAPACQIKAGAEMSMLEALRRAEEEARKAVIAMHEEGTDGWTAFRRLEGRTRQNSEAAENLGYERGLRDGRAEAPQFFGPYAHLNGHRALSEDSWTVEDDPISNDVEYFSIPLFAKVDVTFPVTYGEPDAAAYEAYANELRALATDAKGVDQS